MATTEQVKRYLGCWFQLGKKLLLKDGQSSLCPASVLAGGDRYSPEFESCWQQIESGDPKTFYLEGTDQTVADLLSQGWEIADCARCAMPVPIHSLGLPSLDCPCHDLAGWPNTELPQPRSPVNNQQYLSKINRNLMPQNRG